MLKDNVILGGGLAGLIWGVYHPNCLIVEPGKIGGMVHENMGPMMIHHTLEVEEFIEKIGLNLKTRTVNIGYTTDLRNFTPEPPYEGFRADYYRHSRILPRSYPVPSSAMSGGSSKFECIDIPIGKIIDNCQKYILENEGVFLKTKVNKVEKVGKEVEMSIGDDLSKIVNTNVISTIPMPIFQKLVEQKWVRAKDGLTKVFVKAQNPPSPSQRDYDYIYVVPYYDSPLTRITVTDNEIVYEYTIKMSDDPNNVIEMWRPPLFPSKESSVVRGVVRLSKHMKEWNGIKFIGRTAQWDHSIKLNDVIKEAQDDS